LNWVLIMTSLTTESSDACSASYSSMLACNQTELIYATAAATGASLVSAAVFMASVPSRNRKSFYKPCSWARQAVDTWDAYTMQDYISR